MRKVRNNKTTYFLFTLLFAVAIIYILSITLLNKPENLYGNLNIVSLKNNEIFFISGYDQSLNNPNIVPEYNASNVCKLNEDYLTILGRYGVDKNFAENLCKKTDAMNKVDIDKCKEIENDFISGLCTTEVSMIKDSMFCDKTEISITRDFCIILKLREEVGYYPIHDFGVIACDGVINKVLNAYCKEAYKRKE